MFTWPPNSSALNPVEHLWDVIDKHGGPTPNLPQHTFRGVVECMPLRVRAILTAKEGPPQSWAGDHNVMPHLCM